MSFPKSIDEQFYSIFSLESRAQKQNREYSEKAFKAFTKPSRELIEAIKNLKRIRSRGRSSFDSTEVIINTGPCTCISCGRGYFGNTFVPFCSSCERLLNRRFFYLYNSV